MRNAYAVEETSQELDFYRPIEGKECEKAKKFSCAIKTHLASIDIVYCSSAQRGLETYEAIKAYLKPNHELCVFKGFYTNRGNYQQFFWELINKSPDSANALLFIGHNPGLTLFFNSLNVSKYRAIHFPTLGLAQISFGDVSWECANMSHILNKDMLV